MVLLIVLCCLNNGYSAFADLYESNYSRLDFEPTFSPLNANSIFNPNNSLNLNEFVFGIRSVSRFYNTINDSSHLYFNGYGWVSPFGKEVKWKTEKTIGNDSLYYLVNELYFDYVYSPSIYWLCGQKREAWGNGILWNPANVIDPQILYDRPIEAQKGRIMVRNEQSYDWGSRDIYLMPVFLNSEGSLFPSGVDLAFKITGMLNDLEINVGGVQTCLTNNGVRKTSALGVWMSRVYPNNLTFTADYRCAFLSPYLYPSDDDLNENIKRKDQLSNSVLLGLSLRVPYKNITIRGEYFYNGWGYTLQERQNFINGFNKMNNTQNYSNYQKWLDVYEPYLLSQNYLGFSFLYSDILGIYDWQFQTAYGIDDQSVVCFNNLNVHLNDKIDLYNRIMINGGKNEYSEFKQQIYNSQFAIGISFYLI